MRKRELKQGSKERISIFNFNVNDKQAFVQIVHGDPINGDFVAFPVQNPEGYQILGEQFEKLCNDGFSEASIWKLIDEIRAAALINYNAEV